MHLQKLKYPTLIMLEIMFFFRFLPGDTLLKKHPAQELLMI